MQNADQTCKGNASKVIKVSLGTDGARITIKCLKCKKTSIHYLTTIGGLALGEYTCDECFYVNEVYPELFQKQIKDLLPNIKWERSKEVMEESTRITETWYQKEPFKKLLKYKGVNLGIGAERELVSMVAQGICRDWEGKKIH